MNIVKKVVITKRRQPKRPIGIGSAIWRGALALVFGLATGAACGNGASTSDAPAPTATIEIPECTAYATAFERCMGRAVGEARAAESPHPVFQGEFHDDASREKVRERCIQSRERIEQACR